MGFALKVVVAEQERRSDFSRRVRHWTSPRGKGASPEEYEQMMDPSYGVRRVFPVGAFHRQIHSLWDNYFPSDSPPIFTKFAAMK